MVGSFHDGKEYPNVDEHDWKQDLLKGNPVMRCIRTGCGFVWQAHMNAARIPKCKG